MKTKIHFANMDIFDEASGRLCCERARRPHCKTCVCYDEVEIKSKITVSKPQLHMHTRRLSPCKVNSFAYDYGCSVRHPTERDLDSMFPPLISPRKIERTCQCDNKYRTFEKWFRRFDFDCNGFLDLFELRTMLNFLGVQAKEDYCKRLLDRADRDRDGRLTFSEFLLMWRLAQDEEELMDIIREHDLYPDVLQVDYVSKLRPKAPVITKRKVGRHHKCGCETTTTKTFRLSPKEESIIYESEISHSTPGDDKLPIFSCYR
nr:uncharacterized protein LOC107451212 isoform X2 [Parasteatoda tepidariorum]